MSNFDKLFGRTYSTVGNSDSDFIIKLEDRLRYNGARSSLTL